MKDDKAGKNLTKAITEKFSEDMKQGPDQQEPEGVGVEDHGFAGFMKTLTSNLVAKEVVKSGLSGNTYSVVGEKDGSKVGVSAQLSVVPYQNGDKPVPVVGFVIRFLEVPEQNDPSSVFANPGEEREYEMHGAKVTVNMLSKSTHPLCHPHISPAGLKSLVNSGPRNEIVQYIWDTLLASGVAINCKSTQELDALLFHYIDDMPDEEVSYWSPLKATTKAL